MMEQGGRLSSTTTTTLAITPMNEETVSYKKKVFLCRFTKVIYLIRTLRYLSVDHGGRSGRRNYYNKLPRSTWP